jgi:hypothetical protein
MLEGSGSLGWARREWSMLKRRRGWKVGRKDSSAGKEGATTVVSTSAPVDAVDGKRSG